jgi:hypothetical protein
VVKIILSHGSPVSGVRSGWRITLHWGGGDWTTGVGATAKRAKTVSSSVLGGGGSAVEQGSRRTLVLLFLCPQR